MKVKELIVELQKCNPEAIVIYTTYDTGMDKWEITEVDGADEEVYDPPPEETDDPEHRWSASYLGKSGQGNVVHLR